MDINYEKVTEKAIMKFAKTLTLEELQKMNKLMESSPPRQKTRD